MRTSTARPSTYEDIHRTEISGRARTGCKSGSADGAGHCAQQLTLSTGKCAITGSKVLLGAVVDNVLAVAELMRRGMAAIEEGLQRGPLRILKRNRLAAVVLSEDQYRRLTGEQSGAVPGLSVVQWLLMQPATGERSKADLVARLAGERDW